MLLREDLGRPEEALALHRRANELDPLSGMIKQNVVADMEALGRFDEAQDWIGKLSKLAPNGSASHEAAAAYAWLISGQLDEAVVRLTQALALDPSNTRFLKPLGLVYLDLGDPIEAERWLGRSIELGPESLEANVGMQLLELYRGAETQALEHARKAFSIHPYVEFGVGSLEFLRDHELRAGRNLEAQTLYEKSYPELFDVADPAVDRRNYKAAIGLALIRSRAGEQKQADPLLDRSLEQMQAIPRLGWFGYGIADVQIYAIRGEREKAVAALRKAIDEGWRGFWWYYLEHDLSLASLHAEPEFQAMVEEIRADMASQLARVREMERNGELAPIPELAAE
jgi:tetratricopeptide (TPR) repeat protein